ncbi:hypothetical protein V6N13_052154 [Hibiscus sabdariffa]
MDASRGRRGHRLAQGRRRGRRDDQVGVDAPPTQDPPIVDPPTQYPPVGDSPTQDPPVGSPPVRDPPVYVVDDPDDFDKVMVGCVVWRLL